MVVDVGDTTGDGSDDVAIGERWGIENDDGTSDVTVWLLEEGVTGTWPIEEAARPVLTKALEEPSGDELGSPGLRGIGDFDGNGTPDMFINASQIDAAYIVLFGY